MSNKVFKLSVILVLLTFVVSGCSLPWKKKTIADEPIVENAASSISTESELSTTQMKKFENYNDLKKFLEENNGANSQNYSGVNALQSLRARATNFSDTGISKGEPTPVAFSEFSTTNNQVAGVDEADIIKTDGTYIYALVRNDLKIIKVNPVGEASVISTITFKSRPQNIFINGTSLAVFGVDQQIYSTSMYRNFRRQNPYTFFKVYDLTNPTDPRLIRDLNFEGIYADARLIGDYAYLFTNSYGNYIENEPLLPRVIEDGELLPSVCDAKLSSKCFVPDVYYFDIPYDSYSFENITAINIRDNNEAISGQSYIMNAGQNIYVSQSNIYLTYTERLNQYDLEQVVKRNLIFPLLTSDDQDKITKIEAAANYILSKNEKKSKVFSIIDRYLDTLASDDKTVLQAKISESLKQKLLEKSKDMEKTVIHKIAIDGASLKYRGMGEVNGQVLNQFSMDESGNYFRIATTRSSLGSSLADKPEQSYSNVFVLDNELKTVGSLENLATDEQIYSARFMGDRVYLVTFKKTDPLYVIGLSDPSKPSVLGALKVPGYSTYLQPADKNGNKLIGFGRDTELNTDGSLKIKGLKVALFDFTDLTQPKELDSFLIGDENSDSIALQDHKAFLYSEDKNLLVIPAISRENNKITFAGSLVFNIIDNRFVLKGKIDHSEGGNFSNADYWNGYDYYDNTVKRNLYINDNLFTFSNKFLKINSLSNLSLLKNVILTSGGNDYTISPAPSSPPQAEMPGEQVSTPENPLNTTENPASVVSPGTVGMVNGEIVSSSTESNGPPNPVLQTDQGTSTVVNP